MPASLIKLPAELLIEIIRNIPKNGHLLNLALCCRALHDSVLPQLFEHITLKAAPDEVLNLGPTFPKLRLLVTRLLHNPYLASRVRKITLGTDWSDKEFGLESPQQDRETLGGRWKSEARKLCKGWAEEDIDELITALESNIEDALVAPLFQSTVNIEVINIVVPFYYMHFSNSVFESAVDQTSSQEAIPPPFDKLRTVANSFGHEEEGTSTDLLYQYMQIPSIREIYVQQVGSDGSEEPAKDVLMNLKAQSSNVEHLELRQCRLNGVETLGLLGACKNLKTFVYDLGSGGVSDGAFSMLDLEEALESTARTLENLWLDCWADPDDVMIHSIDEFYPIQSLCLLQKLKNLRVGMYVLFGVDDDTMEDEEQAIVMSDLPELAEVLPDSLETLYISHTHGRIGILSLALQRLLQDEEVGNIGLTQITIEVALHNNENAPPLEPLKQMAKEKKVQLKILDIGSTQRLPGSEEGRGWDGLITWAGSMKAIRSMPRFTIGKD